jgi:hypothetical protein
MRNKTRLQQHVHYHSRLQNHLDGDARRFPGCGLGAMTIFWGKKVLEALLSVVQVNVEQNATDEERVDELCRRQRLECFNSRTADVARAIRVSCLPPQPHLAWLECLFGPSTPPNPLPLRVQKRRDKHAYLILASKPARSNWKFTTSHFKNVKHRKYNAHPRGLAGNRRPYQRGSKAGPD